MYYPYAVIFSKYSMSKRTGAQGYIKNLIINLNKIVDRLCTHLGQMTESLICYSPELISELDKEEKDYPIDPMVLAILNGIKKIVPPTYHSGNYAGSNSTAGRGKSFGTRPHRPDGHNGSYGNFNSANGVNSVSVKGRGRNIAKPAPAPAPLAPRRKLFTEEGNAFLVNIRNCLARLSSENYVQIGAQLLSYELDKDDTLKDVVKILHESAINGVFIVDYYVDIFLSVANKYPKIVPGLNERILQQINKPNEFADEEDMLTESRQQKVERWQIANIHIFAELYRKNVYKEELFRKVLRILLKRSSVENPFALKLIVELMQKVIKSYDLKRRDADMNELIKSLEQIGRDKNYPSLVRLPLLNAVTEFNEATL